MVESASPNSPVVPEVAVSVAQGEVNAQVNVAADESIVASTTAIEVAGDAVINNEGFIAGAVNGIDFDETGTGQLNNDGLISSDSRALEIDGEGLTVNNNGAILGTDDQRNGTVYVDETGDNFELNNNGLIDAGESNEGAGFSAELDESGNTFDINNNGSIVGRGDAAAGTAGAGDGIRLERTRVDGALDGSTSGAFDGTINNSGSIVSEGANGTVAGFRSVDGVDFNGELNNSGSIAGTQNGVYFGDADNTGGELNNDGLISSDSRALNIDGEGLTVNNNGAILGTDDQRNGTVYVDETGDNFELNNNGLIDAGESNEGAGFSAELDESGNTFDINNNGSIVGRGDAAAGTAGAGDGIRLERTRVDGALDGSTSGAFDGTINNSGSIVSEGANGTVAGFRSVDGVDFNGELNNSGSIAGTQNGVYFGDADNTGGELNNDGLISSDSRAVNVDGDGLTVNNNGLIEATGRQRNGTLYVDGTADNFEINNNGAIDARGGAGSGVSLEVGSEDGDTQVGAINNDGAIYAAGELNEDAGVRLANGVEGETTFKGDIVNSGLIAAEDGAAVLVEEGVNLEGDLVNSGTIDGGIDLSSGDVILEDGSVVYLDVAGEDDVEQISTTGDVQLGGVLNVRFQEDFTPEVGQTFDLVDFGAASGQFATVESEGVEFDLTNLAVDGTVTILSTGQVVAAEDVGLEVDVQSGMVEVMDDALGKSDVVA